jgi:hypothetical protein
LVLSDEALDKRVVASERGAHDVGISQPGARAALHICEQESRRADRPHTGTVAPRSVGAKARHKTFGGACRLLNCWSSMGL